MLETGGGKGERGRLGGRGAERGGTLGAGGRGEEGRCLVGGGGAERGKGPAAVGDGGRRCPTRGRETRAGRNWREVS
jgi:hypothetical protein